MAKIIFLSDFYKIIKLQNNKIIIKDILSKVQQISKQLNQQNRAIKFVYLVFMAQQIRNNIEESNRKSKKLINSNMFYPKDNSSSQFKNILPPSQRINLKYNQNQPLDINQLKSRIYQLLNEEFHTSSNIRKRQSLQVQLQKEITQFITASLDLSLKGVNRNIITIKQCKVKLAQDIITIYVFYFKTLFQLKDNQKQAVPQIKGNQQKQAAYSLQLQKKIQKIEKYLNQLINYLKFKYPRNQKIQAGSFAQEFIQFDRSSYQKYNLIHNLNINFYDIQGKIKITDDYENQQKITNNIKIMFNKIIDELNQKYPKFQKLVENKLFNLNNIKQTNKQNNKGKTKANEFIESNPGHNQSSQNKKISDKSYKIGRKISQNTQKFNKMNTGSLQITSSAVLRIFIKWMQDLVDLIQKPQNKLDPNNEHKYKAKKQKKIKEKPQLLPDQPNQHIRPEFLLNNKDKHQDEDKLDEREDQNNKIANQYRKQENLTLRKQDLIPNHQSQSLKIKQHLPHSLKNKFKGGFIPSVPKKPLNMLESPEQKQNIIEQLIEEVQNLSHFVTQINQSNTQKLKNFSLRIMKIFSSIQKSSTHVTTDEMQLIKLSEYFTSFISWMVQAKLVTAIKIFKKINQHETRKEEANNCQNQVKFPSINFEVNDLMRCQYFGSKQELLKIYQNFKYLHEKKQIEVVKLKNRLNSSLNDVMIFFKMADSPLICQCQLILHSKDKDQSAKNREQINHFLYELQRSEFHIIGQASVFMKYNVQFVSYCPKIETQTSELTAKQILEICKLKKHQIFIEAQQIPFICFKCGQFYGKYSNYKPISKCQVCLTKFCNLCMKQNLIIGYKLIINTLDEKIKLNLKRFEMFKLSIQKEIQHADELIMNSVIKRLGDFQQSLVERIHFIEKVNGDSLFEQFFSIIFQKQQKQMNHISHQKNQIVKKENSQVNILSLKLYFGKQKIKIKVLIDTLKQYIIKTHSDQNQKRSQKQIQKKVFGKNQTFYFIIATYKYQNVVLKLYSLQKNQKAQKSNIKKEHFTYFGQKIENNNQIKSTQSWTFQNVFQKQQKYTQQSFIQFGQYDVMFGLRKSRSFNDKQNVSIKNQNYEKINDQQIQTQKLNQIQSGQIKKQVFDLEIADKNIQLYRLLAVSVDIFDGSNKFALMKKYLNVNNDNALYFGQPRLWLIKQTPKQAGFRYFNDQSICLFLDQLSNQETIIIKNTQIQKSKKYLQSQETGKIKQERNQKHIKSVQFKIRKTGLKQIKQVSQVQKTGDLIKKSRQNIKQ